VSWNSTLASLDHDQLLAMSWQQVIENLSVDINIHKVVKIKQVCCLHTAYFKKILSKEFALPLY
jgi:hypothetical protein